MTAARWRAAFVAASVAWAVLILVAPFAASRPHASPMASALIVGVYAIGSLVCHQLAERSYHLWTAQMPVCARCAGIYVGAALSALLTVSFRTAQAVRHLAAAVTRGFSPANVARRALALAVAPTLVTLAYEWTTGDMPSHAIRAAAGVPLGVIVAWLIVAAADNQVN